MVGAAAVASAVAMAIVVRGLGSGPDRWQAPYLAAFVAGLFLCGVGVSLIVRGVRQRTRMRVLAELLPAAHERLRLRRAADATAAHPHRLVHGRVSAIDDTEWADEATDAPRARADMRAATRALLVSLEDELRREAANRVIRPGRPACRRARLRAAGRGKPGVRRSRPQVRRPIQFS